jgi:EAL domain-containing protein (putative c-di-GMP-specific phosphodiesterase class I)
MRIESVEVLARAEAANGDIRGPETIVQAMTGTAESMALTGAILRHAITDLRGAGLGRSTVPFAFNLPLNAMLHPNLLGIIRAIRGASPQKICFELTERHPVKNIAEVEGVIATLREAGYLLALDDVTPAMTNLDALIKLPIHAIKLDASVVNADTQANNAFIRHLTNHAQTHNQQIIAEGIETPETLARMRGLNVTHAQGFLLSHPLPAAELVAFFNK